MAAGDLDRRQRTKTEMRGQRTLSRDENTLKPSLRRGFHTIQRNNQFAVQGARAVVQLMCWVLQAVSAGRLPGRSALEAFRCNFTSVHRCVSPCRPQFGPPRSPPPLRLRSGLCPDLLPSSSISCHGLTRRGARQGEKEVNASFSP